MMLNGFRLLLAVSMVLALWGGAYAWEGRMGGMGDPYGLVSDESDLFILPTRIVDGTGIQYYGDVRFMYHDLSDMNWNARLSGSLGFLGDTITGVDFGGSWGSSGNVWDYSTRVGVTLPAGTGRLGLFFKYTGQRGSYDGTQTLAGSIDGLGSASAVSSYNMRSDYDDFNFRITYGRPLGSDLRIGGEIQVGYHQETNKYRSSLNSLQVLDSVGDPVGIPALALQMENDFLGTLFPFMKPFDSSYWEMLFKAGVEGHFGPAWIGMDVRGGPLFGGDNTWSQSMNGAVLNTDGTTIYSGAQSFRLKGDVSGWKLGGDFWLRVPVSDSLSVPFSVTVDYLEKTRGRFRNRNAQLLRRGHYDYDQRFRLGVQEYGEKARHRSRGRCGKADLQGSQGGRRALLQLHPQRGIHGACPRYGLQRIGGIPRRRLGQQQISRTHGASGQVEIAGGTENGFVYPALRSFRFRRPRDGGVLLRSGDASPRRSQRAEEPGFPGWNHLGNHGLFRSDDEDPGIRGRTLRAGGVSEIRSERSRRQQCSRKYRQCPVVLEPVDEHGVGGGWSFRLLLGM